MKLLSTAIAGVVVAYTEPLADQRGVFTRLFCERNLAAPLDGRRIVQINHSRTRTPGTIRGMHYQYRPSAEMKMVRCLSGRVFDVAVDLRAGSPTFLRWHAEELTPESGAMLIVPEGCAHGFQVLEPDSELLYLHTSAYAPEHEAGVRFDDPGLGIRWPLPVMDVSARDGGLPLIASDFAGLDS